MEELQRKKNWQFKTVSFSKIERFLSLRSSSALLNIDAQLKKKFTK